MNHEKIYPERVEIRVSKNQRKILDRVAKEQGLTLSQLIRNAVDQIIK